MARSAKQVASQLKAAKASAAKRRKAKDFMSKREVKYGDAHTTRKGNSVRAVSNQMTVKNQKILRGSTYRYGPGKSNTTSRSKPQHSVGGKKTWVSMTPSQQSARKARIAKQRSLREAKWKGKK